MISRTWFIVSNIWFAAGALGGGWLCFAFGVGAFLMSISTSMIEDRDA